MRNNSIYERYETLSPIYQGYLTNHVSMALTAMKFFGFTKSEMIQRLNQYIEERSIFDLTEVTTPVSEFEQAYINRTSFYVSELNNKGMDVVIGSFINKHKMVMGSALFHGLIRLSYAKTEGNSLPIAQALSYYEITSEKLEFPNLYCSKDSFFKSYETLLDSFRSLHYEMDLSRTTMERFQDILEINIVKQHIRMLHHPTKEFVLDFVLSRYVKTQSFIALHLITGFEALLQLEEYIFDFDNTLNQFFLYAQVFSLFQLREVERFESNVITIEEANTRVKELQDIHHIKLLYSLQQLSMLFQNDKINEIISILFHK